MADVVADDLPPETRIALDGLRKALGGLWPSVERFLQRRNVSTFPGWIHEMLKLVTGSQFTADDLAQTCDDDAALERPIGSPYALRKFLQKTRMERVNGNGAHSEPLDVKPRRRPAVNGGGARNDDAIDAATARLEAARGER